MTRLHVVWLSGLVAVAAGLGVVVAGGEPKFVAVAVASSLAASAGLTPWFWRRIKLTLNEARDATRELNITLRAMGEGVVTCDVDGKLRRMNPAAEALLQHWAVEVQGQPLASLVEWRTPDPDGCGYDPVATVVKTKAPSRLPRLILRRRDGSERLVALVATPMLEGDTVLTGVVLVVSDITAEHQLEEHVRRSQRADALARLASGVAPDFNNLLQVLRVNTEFLSEKRGIDAQGAEYVGEIARAAARAADLTGQLLTLGRRRPMRQELLDARGLVGPFIKVIQRLMGSTIEVEFTCLPTGLWVAGDPGELEQVLLNLCDNARIAMPVGGTLAITLDAREVTPEQAQRWTWSRPGHYVVLTVRDTGLGMDDATRARIFEPFYTTRALGEGAGLGLSVVLGTIQQHRGFINVESRLGHGSTFEIFLPQESPPVELPLESASGEAPATNSCILVVEDEPTVRMVATAMLVRHGYRVIEATDGMEACEVVRARGKDLAMVVMDVVMPRLGGVDAARQIGQMYPALPIVLCTGCMSSSTFGEDGHRWHRLAKPFGSEELLRAVKAACSGAPPTG